MLRAWAERRRGWRLWSKRLLRWAKRRIWARVAPARWTGRRLRPLGVLVLRLLGARRAPRAGAAAIGVRAATRASAVLTPERAICAVDRRLAVCLHRLPVRRLPRRRGRPARLRGPAGGARRRRSTPRPPARPTPTCWSRSRCSPPPWRCCRCARRGRRRLGRVVFAPRPAQPRRRPPRRPARRARRGAAGLALLRRHGGPRGRLLRRARRRGGLMLAALLVLAPKRRPATMRGRAEHEPTCTQGPQAP